MVRLVKIQEVVNNLDFEKVSIMPLELRGGVLINTRRKLEDGAHLVSPGDTYRNSVMSGNWRQFSCSQKMILNDMKLSKVSVDKVTKFGLRPPELLQLFNKMGDYFRWFNFGTRILDSMIELKLTNILLTTCWIDGLQTQIRVRKKALSEIIAWCDFVQEEEGTKNFLTEDCDNNFVEDMILVFQIINNMVQNVPNEQQSLSDFVV